MKILASDPGYGPGGQDCSWYTRRAPLSLHCLLRIQTDHSVSVRNYGGSNRRRHQKWTIVSLGLLHDLLPLPSVLYQHRLTFISLRYSVTPSIYLNLSPPVPIDSAFQDSIWRSRFVHSFVLVRKINLLIHSHKNCSIQYAPDFK